MRPGSTAEPWTLDPGEGNKLTGPNGEEWGKHDVGRDGDTIIDKLLHPEGPISIDQFKEEWGNQFDQSDFRPWGPTEWENYGPDKWGRVSNDMAQGKGPW